MKTFGLSEEEHVAIRAAILSGALLYRQATLRTMVEHNRDHPSLANFYERELEALIRAADVIVAGGR